MMPPVKQCKVLLVEDEKMVMRIHKIMLEEIGCLLDNAENGQQALSMAQNGYDLILMDIGLPDINGIDVTTKIRQLESGKRVPIVGLTAFSLQEIEEKCLSAGMHKVITKPTTVAILKELIVTYS